MFTFIFGLVILFLGYLFYSKYVEKNFEPTNDKTPAYSMRDDIDFLPLNLRQNELIQLLNIAGIGPLMGAVQGILFGPIAFLLIPIGCILMGGVHDYFSGMISLKNSGAQITELSKKYLGKNCYLFFGLMTSILLLLVTAVFVYTSGDLIAEKFFKVSDFSLSNPTIVITYIVIVLYFILATLFPIDKIIGKIYPYFGALLLIGTLFIFIGFFVHGIELAEFSFSQLNHHPNKHAIIPIFFMTVSCGMLSGFHATQSTIISRTVENEHQGRKIFYGMMCVECLISMIWAAGAMSVYSMGIVPEYFVGKANVLNIVADKFLPHYLTYLITIAIVILPITSGDTALRSLRLLISEVFNKFQNGVKKSLAIMIPITVLLGAILIFAKMNNEAFFIIWRYFTFANELIALIVFMISSVYLFAKGKNYFITLIPAIFCMFISYVFILNAKIGFNLSLANSKAIAIILTVVTTIWLILKMKNFKKQN